MESLKACNYDIAGARVYFCNCYKQGELNLESKNATESIANLVSHDENAVKLLENVLRELKNQVRREAEV